MKKLFFAVAVTAILSACGASVEKKVMDGDLYAEDYTVVGPSSLNISVNSRAVVVLVDSQAEYLCYSIEYPDYGAKGTFSVVTLDSARLVPVIDKTLQLMEMHADTIRTIDGKYLPEGYYRWVFTHPAGRQTIQWLATDSSTVCVSGRIRIEAASDSTVDISPALENIRRDIVYFVDHLTLAGPDSCSETMVR